MIKDLEPKYKMHFKLSTVNILEQKKNKIEQVSENKSDEAY